MRHTPETKKKALASIEKIGVKKTREAMGISAQTLYKWKNEGKEVIVGEKKPVGAKVAGAQNAIKANDDYLQEKIAQLEAENAALRTTNANLKKALLAFMEE